MRDVLNQAYEECPIGDSKWVTYDIDRGETLEGFQSVLAAATVMCAAGKLVVQETHHESHSGKRLTDRIKFMRLR